MATRIPQQTVFRRFVMRFAVPVILVVIAATRAGAQRPEPTACGFSSPAKSSLAWQTLLGRDTLAGRVVRVRDLQPVTFGTARLDPGAHRAVLDGTGAFRFERVLPGRYFLRVQAGGYPEAADSVTIGQDGLYVLAAVGTYAGDLVVTCPGPTPARKPSNER